MLPATSLWSYCGWWSGKDVLNFFQLLKSSTSFSLLTAYTYPHNQEEFAHYELVVNLVKCEAILCNSI